MAREQHAADDRRHNLGDGSHRHDRRGGVIGAIRHLFSSHSHDHPDSIDAAAADGAGMRALAVSLGGLGVTAVLQVIVVAVLADRIEHELGHVNGIDGVDRLRVRWIGHELHADADVAVNATLDLTHTHDLLEDARHRLLHTIPRLTDVLLHANPAGCHHAHERLRHHDRHAAA